MVGYWIIIFLLVIFSSYNFIYAWRDYKKDKNLFELIGRKFFVVLFSFMILNVLFGIFDLFLSDGFIIG